jgi:hypothetical protein
VVEGPFVAAEPVEHVQEVVHVRERRLHLRNGRRSRSAMDDLVPALDSSVEALQKILWRDPAIPGPLVSHIFGGTFESGFVVATTIRPLGVSGCFALAAVLALCVQAAAVAASQQHVLHPRHITPPQNEVSAPDYT